MGMGVVPYNPQAGLGALGFDPSQMTSQVQAMSPAELQALKQIGLSFPDAYGMSGPSAFGALTPAQMMPYGAMNPSMAMAMMSPYMSSAYGSMMGGGGGMAGLLQQNAMSQQMLGGMPMNMPGMMQPGALGMPGGAYGGLAGLMGPGGMGGGMGGMGGIGGGMGGGGGMGLPQPAGSENLGGDMQKNVQNLQLQTKMHAWNEAITLASSIESSEHQLNSTIIQNMR